MSSRRHLHLVSAIVVALLCFGQVVFAMDSCLKPQAAAAMAVAEAAMPGCDEMKNVASCVAQCTSGDQHTGHVVVAILDVSDLAPLTLSWDNRALPASSRCHDVPEPTSGPPPPILFCSLLF